MGSEADEVALPAQLAFPKDEVTTLSDDDATGPGALQPVKAEEPRKKGSSRKAKRLIPSIVRAKISKLVRTICTQCRAKAVKSRSNCLEQFCNESAISDLTTLTLRLRKLAKFDMDVEARDA